MTIRRFIQQKGKPSWAVNQDLREEELAKKYPEDFREICENFYRCLNENPPETEDTYKKCLEKALPKWIERNEITKKMKRDFYEVFVEKFEK